MDVYWLEQCKSDVPTQRDWLSTGDLARLSSMRFEKRRADWQLGRWTAKCALASYLHLPVHLQALAEIEIRPAPSGAPEVFLANEPAQVTISLSHRDNTGLCAITASSATLGCDLELVEPRSDAFVSDYFTTEEQDLIAQAHPAERPQLLAILWSAKESALKAMRVGLRLDTRSVAVSPENTCDFSSSHSGPFPTLTNQPSIEWYPLRVRIDDGPVLLGWWQHSHNILRTMIASPSPDRPIQLLL